MNNRILNIKIKGNASGTKVELKFAENPEYDSILRLMEAESEQSVIIVGHSYIEDILDQILRRRLIGIKKRLPVSGFCRMVELCYLIGALTDIERRDLDRLNTIRIHFAHRREGLNFENENISAIIDQFEFFDMLNRDHFTKTLLPYRKKCECEIAYLMVSLGEKINSLSRLEKCPIPVGFNDPDPATRPEGRHQGPRGGEDKH